MKPLVQKVHELDNVVVDVMLDHDGKAAVRFELYGLWFDISSVCNAEHAIPSSDFLRQCKFKVAQQCEWYQHSDNIVHRRSYYMIKPSTSAPYHNQLWARMMIALDTWRGLQERLRVLQISQ